LINIHKISQLNNYYYLIINSLILNLMTLNGRPGQGYIFTKDKFIPINKFNLSSRIYCKYYGFK